MGGVKVGGAGGSFSSSSPQTLSSIFSSVLSSNKTQTGQRRRGCKDCTLITYNFAHRSDQRRQSPFLGTTSPNLPRRRSLDDFSRIARRIDQQPRRRVLRRASSASLYNNDSFFTENENGGEFVRRLEDLALNHPEILPDPWNHVREADSTTTTTSSLSPFSVEPPWPAIEPNWLDREQMVPASVEMKANSVDLPLSLRIIKRKKQQRSEEGCIIREAASCCSVRKAFSSMVFIVRELQRYTLQMREVLYYENLQGILARVQEEMNTSFVWLFQQIFSCTPTLMVCVMLLLANFTVYSISQNSAAMAAASPNVPTTQAVAELQQDYQQAQVEKDQRCDASSSIKSFSADRTASVGGGGSGGGKMKPVAGATDDGGRSDRSSWHLSSTITPDDISPVHRGGDESEAVVAAAEEEEMLVWNRIKEEATRMQASSRDEALMDPDVLHQLVSPVKVESEPEDHSQYWKTELMYHQALSQDPDNAMVLCNFAQFLYLVLHDHDRAEHYFKQAAQVKPADAEALNRYANFLWLAKNDLGAAEEMYLEAIAADPSNSCYAASYAHFLWNTGGEDTCYPLDNGDDSAGVDINFLDLTMWILMMKKLWGKKSRFTLS